MNLNKIVSNYNNKKALTLSEALITLGVLGMVAAITIPTLKMNIQDHLFKINYKKTFSSATTAWSNAVSADKMVERPTWGDDSSRIANFNAFKSNFNVMKDCTNLVSTECWADAESYCGHPIPQSITPSFIDSSGMAWTLEAEHESGGEILVDTNGFKGPNQYGRDRFVLQTLLSDKSGAGGIPTILMPFPDVLQKNGSVCPSGNEHPCYNTSWIYD